jgi:hypothetical protein
MSAPYGTAYFRLSHPPPRARNALAADFLSHLSREVLPEPLKGCLFGVVKAFNCLFFPDYLLLLRWTLQ